MTNKFWMVWRAASQSPSKVHGTVAEACNEARRLAEANPNNNFFVLESGACYRGDITVSCTPCITDSNDEAGK